MNTGSQSTCLSDADLENLASGLASPRQEAEFRRHLESCLSCRTRWSQRSDNEELFKDLREARRAHDNLPEEDTRSSARAGELSDSLPADSTAMPSRVGHYRLKRVIASGGMGTVYEAMQEHPRRVVALKVMRSGIASRSALRRFEYESQILARLRHPNVAQIFDAGTHRDGEATLPYFVMEYIPNARPITQYAVGKNLSTRERLELFVQVCDAVHHGHQKGIIHRDLKPANILVDAHGQVKVIDFGVARSTDSDLAVTTLQTDVGQLVGTLQYMSPEQVQADPHDIDVRSDVYSLGVMLYELLTGRPPYDIHRSAIPEATRKIQEEQPTRLSTVDRSLRGDVETIVLKALEKDRERRYQSAVELTQDIRRYLAGEAITARPPSIVYQLRVFARRNRGAFASLAALFVALAVGAIVSSALYMRAEGARREAIEAQTKAEQALEETRVARSAEAQHREKAETNEKEAQRRAQQLEATLKFVREMLASATPQVAKGRELTVREVLDESSRTIHDKLKDQPLVEASVRWTIADTYLQLGLAKQAIPHFEAVRAVYNDRYGRLNRYTIDVTRALAEGYYWSGNNPRAAEINLEALRDAREALGEEDRLTANIMHQAGNVLRALGRLDEAEPLIVRHIEILNKLNVRNDELMHGKMLLGWLYKDQGRYKEAETLYGEAVEMNRRAWGEQNPWTIMHISELAFICLQQGKWAEAERLAGESVKLAQKYLDPADNKTRDALFRHSWALEKLGRLAEAEQQRAELLRIQRQFGGDYSVDVCVSLSELARMASVRGDADAARGYARELSVLSRKALEQSEIEEGVFNDCAMQLLELAPEELRDPPTALLMARRAVELSREGNPMSLDTLSLALERTGDLDAAIEMQEKAAALASPKEAGVYPVFWDRLLQLLKHKGDRQREDAAVERMRAAIQKIENARDSQSIMTLNGLAVTLAKHGRVKDAVPIYRKVLEIQRARYGGTHPQVALQLNNIGASLVVLGSFAEAEPMLRECIAINVAAGGKDTFSVGNTRSHLGECLTRLGRFDDAEKELLEAHRVLNSINGPSNERTLKAARRLVALFEAWEAVQPNSGKAAKAAEWRGKLQPAVAATQPAT